MTISSKSKRKSKSKSKSKNKNKKVQKSSKNYKNLIKKSELKIERLQRTASKISPQYRTYKELDIETEREKIKKYKMKMT